MWLAKFRIKHTNCILTPKCVKYNINDFVYLINCWNDKKYFYYTEFHLLQGEGKDKEKFLQALKKEKTLYKLEQKGNQVFTLNREPLEKQYYSPSFDRRLIQPKPIIVNKDGYEYWEMACWEKEPLLRIMETDVFKVKLQSIQRKKFVDIFLPQLSPKLAPQQKKAINLAVQEGYYEYPKQIDLERLSKIMNVKRQTFQEHLRRAEKKLVPFLTEKRG